MSTIGRRIERLPFSRFHLVLLLIGGAGYTFDGLDSAIIAFVLPVLKTQWALSGARLGLVGSATYIGFFFGALGAGAVGDRFGRRGVMMGALAVFCVASGISALVSSYPAFLASRILAGLGTGAESAIVAPYLSEFVAARYRGAFVSALAAFFSCGFVAAAVIGWIVVPSGPAGWREAIGLTALPVLALLWWRRRLPESPRWLESIGRPDEAARVMSGIEAQIAARGTVLGPVSGLPEPAILPVPVLPYGGGLLSARHRRGLFVAWTVWLCLTASYYAVFTWMPSLLIARGMTMVHSFGFSILIYAAQLPGYLLASALIEVIGRRQTITSFLLGCVASGGAISIAGSDAGVIAAASALSACLSGAYGSLYAYTPELFPTHLRAIGCGSASAIGRLGAIVSPVLVAEAMPHIGVPGVFAAIAATLLLGGVVVLIFGPRTERLVLEAL
ncbi:MFS transporter [Nguyenibacter vanlangensis]|uniref:MFS transporter n=1 Tax=Nguyenibacter vanlangensis TaxID=1216886 RepID=A0A7Y7IU44_9PROT|nr:MFS transporter [Nguyenibacter vanlangensis]NVN10325.1 MFS transporter [Nguyenibacter vanlangensis]